jgi:hypothetical protein
MLPTEHLDPNMPAEPGMIDQPGGPPRPRREWPVFWTC